MRRLVTLLALPALLAGLLAAPAHGVGNVSDTVNIRLPGGANDPALLALRFSQATFETGSDAVILATEETFADALASGTLQGSEIPLLLTARDDVRADVGEAIDQLGAETVYLLGGEAALDESVRFELEENDLEVQRIYGPTRIETAVEVARLAPESSTAIVSRGYGAGGDDTQAFADALAAGAWAAENGWPLFLTATESLSAPTREAIAASDIATVFLLGGEAAISPEVQAELEALGVEVERVAGQTRFATAVDVARHRGFANAAAAERIILVEGQADDAWAAGFAAAAHGAKFHAPVLLANGDTLPPETQAYLEVAAAPGTPTSGPITEPVLICAANAPACDQARLLLGLPQEAALTIEEPEDGVPSRSTVSGTIDLFGVPAVVAVFGPCVDDGLLTVDEGGAFSLEVQSAPGVCPLEFEITFENGSVQRLNHPIVVAPARQLTGVVIDTETGGDAYTFVPQSAGAPEVVPYSEADQFFVDGQPATIGAFEAAITVADTIVFAADTVEGNVHTLTNVDPNSITSGFVGNVNTAEGTLALVEPVSGVVLRPAFPIPADLALRVDGQAADRATFDANVNEGDSLVIIANEFRLGNRLVQGAAQDIDIDMVSGIARFRVGGLGDDAANAEDDFYRALAAEGAGQTFRVDGALTDFAHFAAALTLGDAATYRRDDGVEAFTLVNAPLPPVEGFVTETFNPDGSPVAPEPSDGGDITVLDADGRRVVSYSAGAVFIIDEQLATEPEFEAARTAGDEVTYQAGDAETDTAEQVTLVNRDLTGDIGDITEGAHTYDVIGLAGVVYDDLNYTAGVFGSPDIYLLDGAIATIDQFESWLAQVDQGERLVTAVIRGTSQGTEHRLTNIETS